MSTPTAQPCVFSRRLREETRRAHSLAENTAFLRGFLRGVINGRHYLRLLADLRHIYAAMETALDRVAPDCPAVATVWIPGLRRLDALERDVDVFVELTGTPAPDPSPAARDYARHIEHLAASTPVLLVAHVYTRYLGDLSGGQVLRSLLRRALGLPTGAGTLFYEFNDLPDRVAAKREFRARLDALPGLDGWLETALIAEANRVFALNLAVFRSLEGSAFTTLRHLLHQTLLSTVRRAT